MILAAKRDASWFVSPGYAAKWHVCDERDPSRLHRARCGAAALLDDDADAVVDARTVPQTSRCQRPGCREVWPAKAQGEERQDG